MARTQRSSVSREKPVASEILLSRDLGLEQARDAAETGHPGAVLGRDNVRERHPFFIGDLEPASLHVDLDWAALRKDWVIAQLSKGHRL